MSKQVPKPGTHFHVPKHPGTWVAVRKSHGDNCYGCEVPLSARGRKACADFPECCSLFDEKGVVFQKVKGT